MQNQSPSSTPRSCGRAGVMPRNGTVIATPANILETEKENYCYENTMKQEREEVLRAAGMTLELWNNVVVIIMDGRYYNFVSIPSSTHNVCKEYDK